MFFHYQKSVEVVFLTKFKCIRQKEFNFINNNCLVNKKAL